METKKNYYPLLVFVLIVAPLLIGVALNSTLIISFVGWMLISLIFKKDRVVAIGFSILSTGALGLFLHRYLLVHAPWWVSLIIGIFVFILFLILILGNRRSH